MKYGFQVIAYVVMPEHVHLLVTEPLATKLSNAVGALKLSVSKQRPERPFWLPRYRDFNVFSRKKALEKIHYIHQNPATRGLVPLAELWPWSSLQQYMGKPGKVTIQPPT